MDFFLINFQFRHVSYIYIAIYHAWMAVYITVFCVILIDCIGFLMRLPTFG